MKKFILMIQFLTRIPINKEIKLDKEDFSGGVVYFPLVGLIIGIINGLVYFILAQIIGGIVPLIAVIISNVFVTGALHLDGLADSCDGIFSARNKDRMLEIMRDSRIGTNGALVLIITILLKIALLDITPEVIIVPTIVLIPVAGRGAMSIILFKSKYAREEGLGDLFIGKTSFFNTAIPCFITFLLVYFILGNLGVIALILSIATSYLMRSYFNKKIGGLTGDLLGAINEVVELIFSICVIGLLGYL